LLIKNLDTRMEDMMQSLWIVYWMNNEISYLYNE
jgi:hypothetical protein